MIRLVSLAVQAAVLATACVIWAPAALGELRLASACVLAVWAVAGGITFAAYLAYSLAPLGKLIRAAVVASESAMWLVPGVLLLAARSSIGVAAGVAAVIHGTRLMVQTRAPRGESIGRRRRIGRQTEPPVFRYEPAEAGFPGRETGPTIFGALALQAGVFAAAGNCPLLAAAAFATFTAISVHMSVSRGALEARPSSGLPYAPAGILLTLVSTVMLSAVLLHTEIVQEGLAPEPALNGFTQTQTPGTARRMLQRLVRVPPPPMRPSATDAEKNAATRLVAPPSAADEAAVGAPGVVLRPKPPRSIKRTLVVPGINMRLSTAEPLRFAFTGEYHLFASSGTLPTGAVVETGSPLKMLFGTTNGGPMYTVAVQRFEPPIDLTHCGKVLVRVTCSESLPILASMRLEGEGTGVDGGTEVVGMEPVPEELVEFQLPAALRRVMVRAIRISFQRPMEPSKSAHVAVLGFTLVPR